MLINIQPSDRLVLEEAFLEPYKAKRPFDSPLGEFTYQRTYARPKADRTPEKWWETIRRVVEGTYTFQKWHCRRSGLPWSDQKAQDSAQEMYDLMFNIKFLPPGRGLWMMGTPYVEEHGSASLMSCGFVSTANLAIDFAEPFCFLMDFSMLGVGVGGNTSGADITGAGKVRILMPPMTHVPFVVEDSREGWVDLIRTVLNSYVGKASFPLTIDYSNVRPEGTPIKGFGGVASGPGPLKALVQGIGDTLNPLIGKHITSTAITDLFNRIGACVVAGNVRRSAEIILGDRNDHEFIHLKNYDLWPEELNQYRWASNNSIYATVGMDYSYHAKHVAMNGEPGFFWRDNARACGRMSDEASYVDYRVEGVNPCGEQSLEDHELCCLVETFPSRHRDYHEYQRTLKFAYLYAKTVTLIPTHNNRVNAVILRNRRIGCSQSGIIDNFVKRGLREHLRWCDAGYNYIQSLDQIYSDWLCVPRSIKTTSVKPSGTVSLLAGVSPGIHYPHSEHYYRTVRVSKMSPLHSKLLEAGYRVEDAITDPEHTAVVYFPIHQQYFDRSKDEVSMWEQLENAALMQHYWSDNQVSITVTFRPEEAASIPHALQRYETRLKAVSFLPLTDHNYEQAPYQTITREEYERAIAVLKPLSFDDSGHEQTDMYCDGEACLLPGVGVK